MKGANIGTMNRRFTFQHQVSVGTTEFNTNKKKEWQDIPTNPLVWGSLENRPGAEPVQADRVAFRQSTTVRIRYRTDLTTAMSFLFDDTRYFIDSIIEPRGFKKVLLEIVAHQSE
jgi:SPP1 family predicted phage head-tail adaptor